MRYLLTTSLRCGIATAYLQIEIHLESFPSKTEAETIVDDLLRSNLKRSGSVAVQSIPFVEY